MGAAPALAVEQAVGRTLVGFWIMPQGGVVPTEPGFSFTVMPVGFLGRISGSAPVTINGRTFSNPVPIGGQLFGNVDVSVSENLLVPQYVYKTEFSKVSLSSTFYLPINWIGLDSNEPAQWCAVAKAD